MKSDLIEWKWHAWQDLNDRWARRLERVSRSRPEMDRILTRASTFDTIPRRQVLREPVPNALVYILVLPSTSGELQYAGKLLRGDAMHSSADQWG